jgi:hypothetical protein
MIRTFLLTKKPNEKPQKRNWKQKFSCVLFAMSEEFLSIFLFRSLINLSHFCATKPTSLYTFISGMMYAKYQNIGSTCVGFSLLQRCRRTNMHGNELFCFGKYLLCQFAFHFHLIRVSWMKNFRQELFNDSNLVCRRKINKMNESFVNFWSDLPLSKSFSPSIHP